MVIDLSLLLKKINELSTGYKSVSERAKLKMMSGHPVLRISSAHNKGGSPDINIAQILHLSNFLNSNVQFIFIYKYSELEKC